MKSSIQAYGVLIVFATFIFLFPQLLGVAVLYRQCNSVASYITEIIEVHEGIAMNNGANQMIQETLDKYKEVQCDFSKEPIEDFYSYKVECYKKVHISILSIPVELHASKRTRRVLY